MRRVTGALSTMTSDLAFSILLFQVLTCSPWGRNQSKLRNGVRVVIFKNLLDCRAPKVAVTKTAAPYSSLDPGLLTFSWAKQRLQFSDTTAAKFWTMRYKEKSLGWLLGNALKRGDILSLFHFFNCLKSRQDVCSLSSYPGSWSRSHML